MIAAVDAPRSEATAKARPAPGRARDRPPPRLFRGLRAGPRFSEDLIAVRRPDPRAAEDRELSLHCRVYNPTRLHDGGAPPLVVVHGGPSLPADYLHPLAGRLAPARAVVFYDQVGCGRSSRPEERCMYSIEYAMQDLRDLVRALQLDKFHLLGHSFGGVVAYEYVAAGRGSGDCLSLALYSTAADFRTSRAECARLEAEVRGELALGFTSSCGNSDPLRAALAGRGTAWGPEDVADYVARPPPGGTALPPALAVRGQHDFVTAACLGGWRDIFSQGGAAKGTAYREEVLSGCAHYGHLEDPCAFGDLIGGHCFVHDY